MAKSVHRPSSKVFGQHHWASLSEALEAHRKQDTSLQTYLELHGGKSVEDFAHILSDDGPRDLVVTLSCGFYSTPCHVIKCNHVGKHSHCFIERAEPDGIEEDLSGVLEQLKAFFPDRAPAWFTPGIFNVYCQRRGAASNRSWIFQVRLQTKTIILKLIEVEVSEASTQTFRQNRSEQEPLLCKSHVSICANANKWRKTMSSPQNSSFLFCPSREQASS